MKEIVLITGANSSLSKKVAEVLEFKYNIKYLTTSKKLSDGLRYYFWDTSKNYIDKTSIANCKHIIHLAGYPVLKRWSKNNKKKIYESRVNASKMLLNLCIENNHFPKTFISASAIGIYDSSNKGTINENSRKSKDWLGKLAVDWEKNADEFKKYGSRVIKLRISLIFSRNAGFLKYNLLSMKFGCGAIIGNANRKVNWMHINDIANFIKNSIINKKYSGAYNLSNDKSISQENLINLIKKELYPYCIIFRIPDFIPRFFLGERYKVIDCDLKISNKKIQDLGFKIRNNSIKKILKK